MKRDRKQRRILLLLVLLLGVTVGFALLSTTLKINGTASIKSATWDIHWENVQPNEQSTVETTIPQISEHATKVSYEVTLELPGDFYEFTVDAKNDGSVNGEITDVRHTVKEVTIENNEEVETTATLPSYIHSTVYYNGTTTPPAVGDILAAGDKQTYVVRIEYDEDSEELPATDKTYRVTTEIDYGQTKKEKVCSSYDVGDTVYFNPVSYSICKDDPTSENCYRWVAISKNDTTYELFMLDSVASFNYSSNNPATIIANATTAWSDNLKTVDSSYDFEPVTGLNVNFSDTKARMLLKSEYDALTPLVQNIIRSECGLNGTSSANALNDIDSYVAIITPDGFSNMFPYSVMQNASGGMPIRPVIKLDMCNGNVKKAKVPGTNPKYNPGDLVYFDPVSNDTCDENTFTYDDVERYLQDSNSVYGGISYRKFGTKTCYKWRVISTNDSKAEPTITLQLDHNLFDQSIWKNASGYTQPPTAIFSNLALATSNWTRVPLLNYNYSFANTKYNYGKIVCNNGTCMIPAGSSVADGSTRGTTSVDNVMATNVRARIITAEELAKLGNFTDLTGDWYSSSAANFHYQDNMNWLKENVYMYPTETAPNINPYHYENETVGDNYDSSYGGYYYYGSSGYWTLTYNRMGGIWCLFNSSNPYVDYASANDVYASAGIRPVIEVPKSMVN